MSRPTCTKVPAALRCDGTADAVGLPCSTKFRPKGRPEKCADSKLAAPSNDGSVQAVFGRNSGLVYPPSSWRPEEARSRPLNRRLVRDYVFGYNGRRPNSLYFISDEECIYPVAALIVVLNLTHNQQLFFEGHNHDVLCVSWNVRRRLCASGQVDPKGIEGPFVCVWSPCDTRSTICQLPHPPGSRSVSAVAFSPDGETLVTFTTSDGHLYFIWRNFAKGNVVCRTGPQTKGANSHELVTPLYSASSGSMPTNSITMLPETGDPSVLFFYTFGEAPKGLAKTALSGHFFGCWSIAVPASGLANAISVTQKRGIFGKCLVPKNPLAIASWPESSSGHHGCAWMVADNGCFYALSGNSAVRCVRITAPGVQLGCLAALGDGDRWIAGGSDGALYLGTADPVPRCEERLVIGEDISSEEAELLRSTMTPRFSNISVRGDLVLLGTSNQLLLLINIRKRQVVRVLQVSHPSAAYAMDFHPSLAILASASIARDVRFWNVAEKRPAVGKILRTRLPTYAVAFSPCEGALLALGCDVGALEIYAFPSLQPVFMNTLSKFGERVGEVRFSPNGSFVAAACWDQRIYLLRISCDCGTSGWSVWLHKSLAGNSSTPTCIMFSSDSQFLMSNSKDTQILYWRTVDGTRQSSTSSFRDTQWQAPWTCVLGWAAIGIWGDVEYDGTDVKSACQAFPPDDGYLAFGDDYGRVKLLRYPNPFVDPPVQACGGHAAFVTKVRFSRTNVLASLGGDDNSVMLWRLEVAACEAPPAAQIHYPWVQLSAGCTDEGIYGFLGAPTKKKQSYPQVGRSMQDIETESRNCLERSDREDEKDPWPALVLPARKEKKQECAEMAVVGADPKPPRTQDSKMQRDRRTKAHSYAGARAWTSNMSGGVSEALNWN